MGKQIIGAKNIKRLNSIINDHGMQARKEDWTDLPEKIYSQPLDYKMTKIQKGHYDLMEEEFYTVIEDEEVAVTIVMNQMNKLQQITSGFIINEDRKPVNITDPLKNPKIQLIEQILEEINGKLLIFFSFKQSFENLKHYLTEKGIVYSALAGGFDQEFIEYNKKMFNEHEEPRVMLAQVSAAKYGHTLLGTEKQPCHTTFFFENSYSLDARIQAEDRNHRHGQRYPVTYLDCVGSDIDRHAVNALQRKLNLSEAILRLKTGSGKQHIEEEVDPVHNEAVMRRIMNGE